MTIHVHCDGCGTPCVADEDLIGEEVGCPACGAAFVVPPHDVDHEAVAALVPAPPVPDVFVAAAAAPKVLTPTTTAAYFGWADACHLGRAPAAALTAGVVLAVFGIVSPLPIRAAMLALPAWGLGYLAWWHLAHDPTEARRRRRLPIDRPTAFARSALIAAVGGLAAIWGLMVHGRAVFDLTAPAAQSVVSVASASDAEAVPVAPVAAPFVDAAAKPVRFAAADVVPPVPVPPSAAVHTPPASVDTAPHIPRETAVSEKLPIATATESDPADAAGDRDRKEQVTTSNLRAIHRALADYAGRYGRYPSSLDDLSTRQAMRAMTHSPFDAPAAGRSTAGYAFPASGCRAARAESAVDLSILYDAAELADHGSTVGITAAGQLQYLDAEGVDEQRAAWAARR